MSMNRIAVVAGAASVAAALMVSSCAISDGDDTADTELTVAWQAGVNVAMDEIIAKFEEDNPDVSVNLTTASDADLQETLRTQLLAGTAPDIFMVWPGSANVLSAGALGPEGFLSPLDDLPWASAANEGALDAAQVDGTPYMAIPAIDSSGAIYNMDTMDELGLSVPETWSDLLQLCADARDEGTVAFGLGLQEVWTARLVVTALVANEIDDVAAFNASLVDGSFNFSESEEWRAALEKQNEMVEAGCFNDSPNGTSMDNVVLPGVIDGDFLATISVGAHIGVMTDPESGDPDGNFLMAPVPSSDDPEASRINVVYNNGMGINADAENLDLAHDFIELYSSEWALNLMTDENSLIPSIPNDDYQAPASLEQVLAFTEADRIAGGDWTPGPDTFSAMTDGVQGLLLESTSIQDVLDSMQSAYEEGLEQ